MASKLAIQKKLELRRASMAQRQLALGENIMLHRQIRAKAEAAMIKSQRIHIQSQLSSMGETNPKIMKMKYEQIEKALGLQG